MYQIKIETGPFVNHIRIETFRTQQTDLGNKRSSFGNQIFQLPFQIGDLMLDPGPADEAEFAVESVEAEIRQGRQGQGGDDQPADEGLLALTCGGRHVGTLNSVLLASFRQDAVPSLNSPFMA